MRWAFWRNERGNVASVFGLSLLPLIMVSGAAIDYSRWSYVNTAVQAQVDSAALSAIGNVRDLAKLSQIELGLAVRLREITHDPIFSDIEVARISDDTAPEAIVVVSAEGTVDTIFMQMFGFKSLRVGASAEARRSPRTYEVSLIVDVTGSMRGARINALRDASRVFVRSLLPEVTDSDRILINIVPYTASVNIGRARGDWLGPLPASSTASPGSARFSNRYVWEIGNEIGKIQPGDCRGTNVTWDQSLQLCHIGNLTQWTGTACPGIERNGICYISDGWAGCVEERGRGTNDVSDATLVTQRFAPYYWPSWGDVGKTNTSNDTRYNSYLPNPIDESRSTNANSNDGLGPNLGCPKDEITDWSNDPRFLLQQIDRFEAWHRGGTMGHVGLAWGWRTLSPRWAGMWGNHPAPRPHDRSLVEKIAVFMTDGVNQFYFGHAPANDSDYTAYGRLLENPGVTRSNQQNHLDAKMLTVCTAMRREGIELFTVGFGLGTSSADQQAKSLLRNCASSPEHFFDATTSNLATYFENIAVNIRMRGERLAR
jgi:Flp pilus assembly protein TadG